MIARFSAFRGRTHPVPRTRGRHLASEVQEFDRCCQKVCRPRGHSLSKVKRVGTSIAPLFIIAVGDAGKNRRHRIGITDMIN